MLALGGGRGLGVRHRAAHGARPRRRGAGDPRGGAAHGRRAPAGAELPELDPPLEGLKREVLALATDFQSREQRLQERLDTSRQQVFFLTDARSAHGARQPQDPRGAAGDGARLRARAWAARTPSSTSTSTSCTASTTPSATWPATSCCAASCRCSRGACASEELLARIGGDEFAVLLENCSADYALQAGAAHARRRAVLAVRVERARLPGGRERGRGGHHAPHARASRPSSTRPTAPASRPRSRAGTAWSPSTRPQASQYMRQTSRGWLKRINDAISGGRLHAALPADGRRWRRRATPARRRAWRRCCA